jgi:hypothetical protein
MNTPKNSKKGGHADTTGDIMGSLFYHFYMGEIHEIQIYG